MLYLRWFASETFPDQGLEVPVDASDVCETISFELRQVREFLSKSELTLLEWSRKRHSRLADKLEEEMEDDAQDPPYVPPKNGGESSSSEEEVDENPKPPKRPLPVTLVPATGRGSPLKNDGDSDPEVFRSTLAVEGGGATCRGN